MHLLKRGIKSGEEIVSGITNWLNRPFPIIERTGTKILYILFFGLFIAIFILLFKPFGFYSISRPYFYHYAIAFGLSSSFSLSIASFIFPFIFPLFFSRYKWNIGKQICFMTLFFIIFTLCNWLFYFLMKIEEITGFKPASITGISFALGIFPSIVYILFVERQYLKAMQSVEWQNYTYRDLDLVSDIELYSSNKGAKYLYKSADIICIKGCGNYFIIYFELHGKIQQQIIRNTLKSVENKLNAKEFIRCHKSYIVNCNKIELVRGNLKNLNLRIPRLEFNIPVSRHLSKKEYQFLLSRSSQKQNINKVK